MKSAGIDLLKTVGLQIDQFLVVSFLSPAAMGLYAAALSLSRMLLLLQSSVVRVLIPRVSARPAAEVVAATSHAARVTFAAGTIPCVLLAFFSPFVLHLAYGNKFIEAGAITRVLAFEALFAGLSSTLSQAFLALGRPGTASLLQGAGLALSVPLMIVLIPHLGLLGAAIALLISTLFRYALVLLSFPWLLHQAAPGIFLTQEDIESVRRRFMRRHAEPSSSAS